MLRNSIEYDLMAKEAIRILIDYDIKTFPLDEKMLCQKMGISLIEYSSFGDKAELFKKRSLYGFFNGLSTKPAIYYNNDPKDISSEACRRQTIRHEIKHFVFEDTEDDEKDDLAEYFGKYLGCPIPVLIMYDITDINQIMSQFGISYEMAKNIQSGLINRMRWHGNNLFDYEIPLAKHIDSDYYDIFYAERGDAYGLQN